jgi:hypothetical protein
MLWMIATSAASQNSGKNNPGPKQFFFFFGVANFRTVTTGKKPHCELYKGFFWKKKTAKIAIF